MDFNLDHIRELVEQSLLEQPTGNAFLDARYEEQVGIIGHTNPYYRLFYLIAQALKPGLVVELGSWQGTAAAHFAIGWPESKVVTIDIHLEDKAAQQRCYEATRHIPNLTYINKWTWDAVEDVRAVGQPIDVIFIDAWHDYEKAMREWQLYSSLLSSPALVIADDITVAHDFQEMLRFWDELPGQKFLDNRVHPRVPMGFLRFTRKRGRR